MKSGASFHRTELLSEFWTCEAGGSPAAGAGPPGPLETDALSLSWLHVRLYAFPLLPLLPVPRRARLLYARVLSVALNRPQRPWVVEIHEMLEGPPVASSGQTAHAIPSATPGSA